MKIIATLIFLVGLALFVAGIGGCAYKPDDHAQTAFGWMAVIGLFVAGRGLDMMTGSSEADDDCDCCDEEGDCDCICHDDKTQ